MKLRCVAGVHGAQMANPDSLDDDPDSGEVHGPKNIRRRVYDALNVLMAMNIMTK